METIVQDIRTEQMKQMRREGMTYQAIANKFEITRQGAYAIVNDIKRHSSKYGTGRIELSDNMRGLIRAARHFCGQSSDELSVILGKEGNYLNRIESGKRKFVYKRELELILDAIDFGAFIDSVESCAQMLSAIREETKIA